MELFLKTFTNNNADTYKPYIRRTCTPKPWPPFGHLFEELFSIGARIRYVKNINTYNNKQLLISRGAWGVPVRGITGIEYNDDQEVADIYGAGRYPVARSKGRITCTGKVTLLSTEINALVKKAPNGRLQNLAPFTIVVSYIPDEGGVVVTDRLRNCQFKSNKRSWTEGDTSKATDIDLAISHIEWGK